MDIPGWIRLTATYNGKAVWLQTKHIAVVTVSRDSSGKFTTAVAVAAHDEPLPVRETVDEVMRLIDAANPPAA